MSVKNQSPSTLRSKVCAAAYAFILLGLIGSSVLLSISNREIKGNLENQISPVGNAYDYKALVDRSNQLALQVRSLETGGPEKQGPPGPRGPAGPAGALGKSGSAGTTSADDISSGTLQDSRLSQDVTLAGNNFNQPGQLIQLDGSDAMPAADGSKLTNVNAASLNGHTDSYYLNNTSALSANNIYGQINDNSLSSNVSKLDTDEIASGNKTYTGDVLFQSWGGSASAFQVQNSNFVPLVGIDDTSAANFITNSSFENDLSGWSPYGASISRNFMFGTQTALAGDYSLMVQTSTGAGGAQYNLSGMVIPNTSYILSVYAQASAANSRALNNFSLGYSDSGFSPSSCLSGQTVPSTYWMYYSCKFTTGSNPTSPAVFISAGDGFGGQTYYLDGAQVTPDSTASAYGGGRISLSGPLKFTGPITSSLNLQPEFDSTALLHIQSLAGSNLLNIDSQNMAVTLGSASSISPVVLVLGGGLNDPTCTNGAMYYNYGSNTFRGCSNSSWSNLGASSTPDSVNVFNSTTKSVPTSTNTALGFDSENYDSNNLHSTVSNTSRLTIQTTGKYSIFGQVKWQSQTDTGYRGLTVMLNGVTPLAEVDTPNINGIKVNQNVNTQYKLNAGDYLELVVFQNSGGALNAMAGGPGGGQFSLNYISN